jgi:hypothetical protein
LSSRQPAPGMTYNHKRPRGDRRRVKNDHVLSSKQTWCAGAEED